MNAISISNVAIRKNANGLFSLNDLHKAAGGAEKHQPNNFLRNQQTKDLINEINRSSNLRNAIETKRGGLNQGTFVCKEIAINYGMWVSPSFNLKVIQCFLVAEEARLKTKALPSGLTHEQQQEVKALHNLLVQSVPFEKQKALAITLWSAVKAKFKVGYKDVPPEQFPEVLSLMARVAVEKGAQYREALAVDLETVPKLYVHQASIPFNLDNNAQYAITVREGKIYRHKVSYSTFPFEDSKIPCLMHQSV